MLHASVEPLDEPKQPLNELIERLRPHPSETKSPSSASLARTFCFKEPSSLHRDTLGQISGLIHIQTAQRGDMVGQNL